MKKLFLTGISLLFALTLTFAQDAKPEDKAKEKVAKLNEKLTLTEEQQTSIYDIVLEHVQAKKAITADGAEADEAKSTLQDLSDAQIKEKLSDDQKSIYDRMIAERPQESRPTQANPSPTPRPDPDPNPTPDPTPPAQQPEQPMQPQPQQPMGQ